MQHGMNCLSHAQGCDNFGLTKKTEVMYQLAPGKPYQEPHITVKGQNLQAVDNFTYQGSTLSRVVHIDTEDNNRIAKASVAFGRLREYVWERIAIRLSTKLKVYHAVLLITLIYSCETWTVYSRHVHANQLNHIHLSCLRRLLHIRWQDKNPVAEVIERAGIPSVDTHLQRAQVRWAGHVARMPGCRLPKQVLYGELCQGKWRFGAEETFQRLHQRRPRSLSSTWLSSTFEGQTTTTTTSTMAREQ